jgi:hypothetical protein
MTAESRWLDRDLTRRREFLNILFSLMAYSEKSRKDFCQIVTSGGFEAFVQIT